MPTVWMRIGSAVQYAVHQVGALFGWRVVIANHKGYIVADSHNVVTQADKHVDDVSVFAGPYIRRPLWFQGREIGVMLVDQSSSTRPPPAEQVWVTITNRRYGRPKSGETPVESTRSWTKSRIRHPAREHLAPLAATAPTTDVISQIAEPSLSRLESSFQRSLIVAGVARRHCGTTDRNPVYPGSA